MEKNEAQTSKDIHSNLFSISSYKIKTALKSVGNVIIYGVIGLAILAVGFTGGFFYSQVINTQEVGKTWTAEQVSVGVTTDEGFMLYNKSLKRFEQYDDNIGKIIFYGYAQRMATSTLTKMGKP